MDFLEKELEHLSDTGLTRVLFRIDGLEGREVLSGGERLVDFSSNDYLGLAGNSALVDGAVSAIRRWGTGARASRLMSGDLEIHHTLERAVADLKGTETGLLFGSGYLANSGIIPSICGRKDVIFSDRLNHASIIDGIMLSRARAFRFRHNDIDHLESLLETHREKYEKALIIAEGLYSMDGDFAPVGKLIELKECYDTLLMLDEAHSAGVYGKRGEGTVSREDAEKVDILLGTFGKAFGGYGAYAAVSRAMKRFLINRARTFIFSTALPPCVIGSDLAALDLMPKVSGLRKRVIESSEMLRTWFRQKTGLEVRGESQIIPVIVGENRMALELAGHLQKTGFLVKAVRPPTVPAGEARIRISVTARHTEEDLNGLQNAVKQYLNSCS
ncbi:MAG TPA: 8-amino-7-oxononanoate synthase [Thermodesulfobacteriaceae bacterium]|nr:8-amino-7-oxononanoate synthase [Thermodesulfobacteriaceae bacterium]